MSAIRRTRHDDLTTRGPIGASAVPPASLAPGAVAELIASLDDDAWSLISEHRAGLREARAEGDAESAEFLFRGIERALFPPSRADDIDYETFRRSVEADPELGRLDEAHRADRADFFRRYQEAKARSGLTTYREIAAKAGVSVTTVQAVESRVGKPHFRTIKKLADAFGVDVTELTGPG